MATANAIIGRSLRLLKVIAAGETIEAGIAADALAVLNSMCQRFLASGLLAAWTDAATGASSLVTPVAQDEALAANLAVLIAPEFEMEAPASVVAMAQQGRQDLWRDRIVATSATSRTAGALILRALRLVSGPKGLPDSVSLPGALVALNAIGNRWLASGLIAAWVDVDDIADAVSTAAKADETLVGTLAARLAREYGIEGIQPPPLDDLWRDRLAPTGVTRTAGDLIHRALRSLPLGRLPDNLTLQGAINALNAIGERWLGSGLIASWTSVTAVADAVSTSAKADDILVAALAHKLAPEYGVTAEAPDLSPLWRDRLAPSGVTRTAGDLILRALRAVGGNKLPDNVSLQGAIVTLNALGARWLASGLVSAWTDVATIADAVSTPASQDEAVVSNLALRLAPEYGATPDGLADAASQGIADLWRDRLADTTTAGTAEDVILRALRVIASAGRLPDTVSFPATLITLNSMLAEWHEAGIGLPDYSFAALSTALASDVGDREAISYQLAIRLAPEYAVSLSAEAVAQARQSMFRLRQRYLPDSKPVPVAYY